MNRVSGVRYIIKSSLTAYIKSSESVSARSKLGFHRFCYCKRCLSVNEICLLEETMQDRRRFRPGQEILRG